MQFIIIVLSTLLYLTHSVRLNMPCISSCLFKIFNNIKIIIKKHDSTTIVLDNFITKLENITDWVSIMQTENELQMHTWDMYDLNSIIAFLA